MKLGTVNQSTQLGLTTNFEAQFPRSNMIKLERSTWSEKGPVKLFPLPLEACNLLHA